MHISCFTRFFFAYFFFGVFPENNFFSILYRYIKTLASHKRKRERERDQSFHFRNTSRVLLALKRNAQDAHDRETTRVPGDPVPIDGTFFWMRCVISIIFIFTELLEPVEEEGGVYV